jgi:hypothetical protein
MLAPQLAPVDDGPGQTWCPELPSTVAPNFPLFSESGSNSGGPGERNPPLSGPADINFMTEVEWMAAFDRIASGVEIHAGASKMLKYNLRLFFEKSMKPDVWALAKPAKSS